MSDYRDAITFAETLPETDTANIGVWGSSYSGGHVLVVGATDRRVQCVVAQVPLISGHRNARRLIRADHIAPSLAMFDADRRARCAGEKPAMIAVVAESSEPCALPTPNSFAWFTETGRTRAPSWRNEVTLQSVEMFTAYEPGAWIRFVSPTPLMLVVALGDHLTVADEALAAYEQALEPKRLVCLNGGHFDAYVGDFDSASGHAHDTGGASSGFDGPASRPGCGSALEFDPSASKRGSIELLAMRGVNLRRRSGQTPCRFHSRRPRRTP